MPQSSLILKDATGAVDLRARLTNVTGTPFASASFDGSGRDFADEYTLTLSGVAGNTATVTVTSASGKNPHDGAGHAGEVYAGIVFDGSSYRNLAPGWTLVTNNTSPANGWEATLKAIWAGVLEAGNPTGQQMSWASGVANPGAGTVSAGAPGFIGKFLATNIDAETLTNCRAVFRPRVKIVSVAGPWAFEYGQVVSDAPTEDADVDGTLQPVAFTFANYDSAASPDEIDVLKAEEGGAASTFNVLNLDNVAGGEAVSTQLKMDGTTRYQVRDAGSHVDEWVFVLATTARDASEEMVTTINKRHLYMAPDVAGVAGTWTQDSVVLTQSGEASGTIQPAGAAPLWVKLDVASLSSSNQNPFQAQISCEYSETGEANWRGV